MHERDVSRNIPESTRRSIASELARFYAVELGGSGPAETPAFSLCRLLAAVTNPDGLRDGREAQICRSAALVKGQHYDPNRPIIPFTALRDLTAASAPQRSSVT